MPTISNNIPLSLYLHFPWCVRKCPYCDFNSFPAELAFNEDLYYEKLTQDFVNDLDWLQDRRPVVSIYLGGGTPSLFSARTIGAILNFLAKHLILVPNIEVTLEANPGTIDVAKCRDFLHAGINRISLGVQSFQDDKLKILQRIHSCAEAKQAITAIVDAGFTNFNLDLMFALPGQTLAQVLADLKLALNFNPPHLSWYQLTIEPETNFYINPPSKLPSSDLIYDMQCLGQQFLQAAGMQQYEISAYARQGDPDYRCRHNLNYWEFGDYLGIGAGAHGKITTPEGKIIRRVKISEPKQYLAAKNDFVSEEKPIINKEVFFEFMLNALRLYQPIPFTLFAERTMLNIKDFWPKLEQAEQAQLLNVRDKCLFPANKILRLAPINPNCEGYIETTAKGKAFLNELLEMLLP